MKKALFSIPLAVVVAFSLCLVGCSSSVTLDRSVTTNGLTYSVSSDWTEKSEENDEDGFEIGSVSYTPNIDYETVTGSDYFREYYNVEVSYSNQDTVLSQTAEEVFDEAIGDLKNDTEQYADLEYSKVSESEIGDAQCSVYKWSYTLASSTDYEYRWCAAYIFAPDMHYEITIFSSEDKTSLLQDILETANVE